MKLLLERDDVATDFKDDDGQTPLSFTALRGHKAVVKLLLERGDVAAHSKDNDGRTPLSSQAAEGHEAVVKLLRSKHSQNTDHT
jgi:ankyrin repeat protein